MLNVYIVNIKSVNVNNDKISKAFPPWMSVIMKGLINN